MGFRTDSKAKGGESKPTEGITWETDLEFLTTLISNLRNCRPNKKFPSEEEEASKIRRAAVAIVLRFNFGEEAQDSNKKSSNSLGLDQVHKANLEAMGFTSPAGNNKRAPEFRISDLIQDVRRYRPRLEILFMKRATHEGDRWSGHVAFPGGKYDALSDLNDFDTATRECYEEIGLDLKSSENFIFLGELDDRFVTSRFGLKNIMVLSPQIFLQIGKNSLPLKLESREVAAAGWVPISHILQFINQPSSKSFYHHQATHKHWFNVDSSVWIDRFSFFGQTKSISQPIGKLMKFLFGGMHFTAIPLPSPFAPTLLWGVTLNIISDFVDLGHSPRQIQKVTPLEYPLPAFDLWPINSTMRWLCRPDPFRKPATCRPSSTWESYFRTLHWVGSLSLVVRIVIVLAVVRFFNRLSPSRIFGRLSRRRLSN